MSLPGRSAGTTARPRRTLRLAVGTSVAVHAALVVAAAVLPAYVPAPESQPMVMVDVVTEVPMPPEPATTPPPPPSRAPSFKPAALKHPVPAQALSAPPPPAAAPTPTPVEEATSPAAPVVAAEPRDIGDQSAPVVVASAVARPAGGVPGGTGSGVGTAGQGISISPAQRSSMVGRYRELLRGRVRDGFRYPPEARELELTGEVLIQIALDGAGRLRGAQLSGPCPHPVLCADALRTIRAAAPFPPLPPELGNALQLEIPLTYSFE